MDLDYLISCTLAFSVIQWSSVTLVTALSLGFIQDLPKTQFKK